MPRLKYLLLFLLLAAPLLAPAQRRPPVRLAKKTVAPPAPAGPAFLRYLHSPWVDSLMRTLTPRQRVGQLFMVAAYSNKPRIYEDSIALLVRDYGIGGAIFFQGGPVRQARMLNRLQAQGGVPLLVAMDGEWGAGMRLDSVLRFPYQMSLGAVPLADSGLIYDMGREVARQFTRLGMQVNFAPVVDVNNNPNNPVIGFRSWGENPVAVARLSGLYMRGMQDAGVLAVAKHFPGHGDVEADSHLALPVVRVDRGRLDSLELPPFRRLIAGGIGGMMVAHLNVPALDQAGGPTTLSPPVVTGLLRQQLGFKGVVFTDAMNMQGVISRVPTGEAEVRALLAGNDVLEFSKNVPVALRAVLAAVDSGRITQQRIDESCRRVLALKQWAGLHHYRPVAERNLLADLNPPHARYLSHRLTQQSLTLLRNQRSLLPLQRLDTLRIATLVLGGTATDTTEFQQAVADYDAQVAHFHLPAAPTLDELVDARAHLFSYDVVLVALQNLGRLPATNFGIAPEAQLLLRELTKPGQQVILTVFGSAYAVAKVRDFDRASAVLLAYQESADAQRLAAQAIFGGIGTVGRLPVTVSNGLPAGFGLSTLGGLRLAYGNPEDAGMDNGLEARVDSIMAHNQNAPGGQVLVARRGVVVLHKSYGVQAVGARDVRNTDLYDLGELTEVLAAAPALLKLQEQNRLNPDSALGHFFPTLARTDKSELSLHGAQQYAQGQPLLPVLPEFTQLLAVKKSRWLRPDSSARFPLAVGAGRWGSRWLPAYVAARSGAAQLPVAGLPSYFHPWLVQQRTGKPFAQFLIQQVYQPLGSGLCFQPLHRVAPSRVVPVEAAASYYQPARGYPADAGAALLGGISGHAGLFGSANDVAQLTQAYAWGGRYGGQQLFRADLLAERPAGLLWPGSRVPGATFRSFWYAGASGTYLSLDPEAGLLVVVLTNQTPSSRGISPPEATVQIQQAAQQALR